MTLECVDIKQFPTLTQTNEHTALLVPSLKLRVQPWFKLLLASIGMTQGLRLLHYPDLSTLLGFALLIPVPGCCYLGWRDYRALREAQIALRSGH